MSVLSKAAYSRFLTFAAGAVFATAAVFAGHVAFAADAPSSNAASSKVKASGIEKVSAEATDISEGATDGNAPAELNANRTTPANTSSASLPKEIKAASPRTVFGELYTETYHAWTDLTNQQGNPRFDSYAGVKFDLGNSRALSLRQNFDYTGITEPGVGKFHVQDVVINYADGKLATFAGDGSVTLIAREYLPTGENTRMSGNMGAERLYLIAAKSYGKLDLDGLLLGQVSNNTKDSYIGADGKEAQNRVLLGVAEFDSLYNVSSKFAVGLTVEHEYLGYRALAGKPDSTQDFDIEPLIQYSPIKGLTFQLALDDAIQTAHPTHDVAIMRNEDISAYFNMSASL